MMQSGARPPCLSPQLRPTAGGVAGAALQKDRIQVPDRDAIVNRDFAGAVAGNAGDQEQDVKEFAGAGEAGMAVDAAELKQGKVRAPKGPGRNDMRMRRHDPSEDLTEGMGKEPTATSATDARGRCQV